MGSRLHDEVENLKKIRSKVFTWQRQTQAKLNNAETDAENRWRDNLKTCETTRDACVTESQRLALSKAQLETTVAQLQVEVISLQQGKADLSRTNQTLQVALTACQENDKTQKAKIQELNTANTSLIEEKNKLLGVNETRRTENEKRLKINRRLEKENANLNKENKKLEEENKTLQLSVGSSAIANERCNADRKTIKDDEIACMKKNAELKDRVEDRGIKNKELKDRNEKCEKGLGQFTGQNEKLQEELKTSKERQTQNTVKLKECTDENTKLQASALNFQMNKISNDISQDALEALYQLLIPIADLKKILLVNDDKVDEKKSNAVCNDDMGIIDIIKLMRTDLTKIVVYVKTFNDELREKVIKKKLSEEKTPATQTLFSKLRSYVPGTKTVAKVVVTMGLIALMQSYMNQEVTPPPDTSYWECAIGHLQSTWNSVKAIAASNRTYGGGDPHTNNKKTLPKVSLVANSAGPSLGELGQTAQLRSASHVLDQVSNSTGPSLGGLSKNTIKSATMTIKPIKNISLKPKLFS